MLLMVAEIHGLKFPPQFYKVFQSLKGPEGAALKIKLSQGLFKSDFAYRNAFNITNYSKCKAQLIHIMEDDLKCPRAANDIKPHLEFMEFEINMARDEKWTKSLLEKDCTYLNGGSANVCQLILSRGTPVVHLEEFQNVMTNCLVEYLEHPVERNESLSDKSAVSVHFVSSVQIKTFSLSGSGVKYLLGKL